MMTGATIHRGTYSTNLSTSNVCVFIHFCALRRPFSFLYCANTKPDDIDLVKDLPVAIQIVGGRFGEENSIGVGKVIDALLRKS